MTSQETIPDEVGALNIGAFPLSDEFTSAGSEVLRDIHGYIREHCAGYLAVAGAIEELNSRGDLPSQIVASYLETVESHAASLNMHWYVKEGQTSPLVQIMVALSVDNSREEGRVHRDYEAYPGRGIRLLVVNQATTVVDGVSTVNDGQIVRTIHGRTWHNAPPFDASMQSPRLRMHTDFYLHDPRKIPRDQV